MPQKNIWDFYSICKRKLDRLHTKKLNQNKTSTDRINEENNIKNGKSSKKKKIMNDRSDNEQQTKCSKNNLIKLQPKIAIDSETRQIILRSNTIIDQTKSPIKSSCSSFSDDFVFKKPQSPAPKARRKFSENQRMDMVKDWISLNQKSFSDFKVKRSLDENLTLTDPKRFKHASEVRSTNDLQVNNDENKNEQSTDDNESNVRKRLFDNLDDLKDKVHNNSTDEFLNKLKDFQQKTSVSSRFNISFYSPSKRAKEQQQERTTRTKEQSINCSPKKYLESRIKNLSSSSSTNSMMTENTPRSSSASSLNGPSLTSLSNNTSPQKSLTNLLNSSHNLSFNSFNSPQKSTAFNLSALTLTSPFKSPVKAKNDLILPERYLELAKTFSNLDLCISQLYNRSENCTFNKIKINVQKLTKKEFDLKQLAQIVTIYPNAYTFNYIKSTDDQNGENYELVIRPYILSNRMVQFTLQIRNNDFRDRLYSFAKRAHSEFLLTLDNPIVLNDIKLKRWHPSFQFPNIPEAKLPEKPTNLSPKKVQSSINDDDIEVIFDNEEDEIRNHN